MVDETVMQNDLVRKASLASPRANWHVAAIALALFIGLFFVYWISIPNHFNEIYNNRLFFDSDGEFITRQFNLGLTFTHNNHLLYHIAARLLNQAGFGVVSAHKFLSVFFGALGVSILYLGGRYWTGRSTPALVAALFVGGSAGYWFFSSSIDTYVPHIASGAAAIVAALACLRTQRMAAYFAFGALLGLAFLFRTDGFLVAVTAIVLLDRPRSLWPRLAALLAGGVLVGLIGYALLAWLFYGIPPTGAIAFAFPDRPEMATGMWGRWANVDAGTLWLTVVNHVLYAVVMPGVDTTRSADLVAAYGQSWVGAIMPVLWTVFLVALIVRAAVSVLPGAGTRANRHDRGWLALLALVWFLPRVVFYTWWDPNDPFLFACTSLPAFWLLWLLALDPQRRETAAEQRSNDLPWFTLSAAAFVAALWLHNVLHLILPMRAASLG